MHGGSTYHVQSCNRVILPWQRTQILNSLPLTQQGHPYYKWSHIDQVKIKCSGDWKDWFFSPFSGLAQRTMHLKIYHFSVHRQSAPSHQGSRKSLSKAAVPLAPFTISITLLESSSTVLTACVLYFILCKIFHILCCLNEDWWK